MKINFLKGSENLKSGIMIFPKKTSKKKKILI